MSVLPFLAAAAAAPLHYADLHLSPVALQLGPFQLRWYSLAYIAGILIGWWYLLRLLAAPGAPMARRHADDLVFYVTMGILIGGRLAYVVFYDPWQFAAHPIEIVKLWDGGMSFHGGALGTVAAILWLARKNGLSALRIHDYIACVAPFGLFFGRLANFVNGELWGRVTDVPWALVFPGAGPDPRHPSQLYEAGLEGVVLFSVLAYAFWRTGARYRPGLLLGLFLIGYGAARFFVEYFREPDVQLGLLPWGLSMGQTLSFPMILVGLWFVATAARRRVRVEPIAGDAAVS
jgi:phosphatidylglycerol:prolipoprotein diacylglycerol transferase